MHRTDIFSHSIVAASLAVLAGCVEREATDLTIPAPDPLPGYCGCKTNVNGHSATHTPSQITELGCSTFCAAVEEGDPIASCTAEAIDKPQCPGEPIS